MNKYALSLAIKEWSSILGVDNVWTHADAIKQLTNNLTEFKRRKVPAVLNPVNREQVIRIVEIADKYKIPLYPISTGKNWGLGSALPVVDNCVILSLKSLNKIIAVNERLRYVIIEPGVTQGQLAQHLQSIQSNLMINSTGSSLDTSIIGNIVDRGLGFFGQRSHALRNVEVLLGNGKIVKTGFWHYAQVQTPELYYQHGLGPDLNHLFTQSNFGVVLSMAVNLLPKRNQILACISFEHEDLEKMIDTLFLLKEENLIFAGPIIASGSDHRVRRSLMTGSDHPYYTWNAFVSLMGSPRLISTLQQEIEEKISPLNCHIHYFNKQSLQDPKVDPFIAVIIQIMAGIPSNFSLDCLRDYFKIHETKATHYDIDNDFDVPGMSCILPAIPFIGERVRQVINKVQALSKGFNLKIGYTLSALDKTAFEGFFRVHFNRKNHLEIKESQRWSRLICDELQKEGIYPYRATIEQMSSLMNKEDDYFDTVQRIKKALDPHSIIAPGRYCPTHKRKHKPKVISLEKRFKNS